jgi:hydroxymethylbilane synthase
MASTSEVDSSERKRTTFTLASRQSELAKIQTYIVIQNLVEKFPAYTFDTRFNETEGDKNQSQALFLIGGKALWTTGLEELLANKQVDMLVHSLKDVPTDLPEGFKLGAILEREERVDSLVMKNGSPYKMLEDMPAGSRIGTSSVRRTAQIKNYLKNHHKDLEMVFKDVRGNLNTRLKKLDATGTDDAFDALILAKAGLVRLGWSHRATEDLAAPVLYHAVSQGALGIEIRTDASQELSELCEALTHQRTQWTCLAERAMLHTLEGGCSVPVGVNTKLTNVKHGEERLRNGELIMKSAILEITGCITSLDGGRQFVKTVEGKVTNTRAAEDLGKKLGEMLLATGAGQILEEIKADRAARAEEATTAEAAVKAGPS